MLVLSRQRDETIMIGDDIELTVVDIRGDKVRLGITAPTTVPVHRKEVYEAIQRENREAAKIRMEDLANLPAGAKPPAVPMRPGRAAGHMPLTRPQGAPINGTASAPGAIKPAPGPGNAGPAASPGPAA